jgi:hypothetical protein
MVRPPQPVGRRNLLALPLPACSSSAQLSPSVTHAAACAHAQLRAACRPPRTTRRPMSDFIVSGGAGVSAFDDVDGSEMELEEVRAGAEGASQGAAGPGPA